MNSQWKSIPNSKIKYAQSMCKMYIDDIKQIIQYEQVDKQNGCIGSEYRGLACKALYTQHKLPF
jgi:hypothetical protein